MIKLRPWNNIKINDCNEPLISIPKSIFRLTPHPYMSLGAPYLTGADPWVLRRSVLKRLICAQQYLPRLIHNYSWLCLMLGGLSLSKNSCLIILFKKLVGRRG